MKTYTPCMMMPMNTIFRLKKVSFRECRRDSKWGGSLFNSVLRYWRTGGRKGGHDKFVNRQGIGRWWTGEEKRRASLCLSAWY